MDATRILNELAFGLSKVDIRLISHRFRPIMELKKQSEIYKELSVLCASKIQVHPEWGKLAGRVRMEGIKQGIPKTYSESVYVLREQYDKNVYEFIMANKTRLDAMIVGERDMNFNLFSVESWAKSYLWKFGGVTKECPQYAFLRVAIQWWFEPKHKTNILVFETIKQVYEDLSLFKIAAPSPVLFNACKKTPQLSSCFVMSVPDNMQGIKKSWSDIADISKNGGGVGLEMSLRHSEIESEGGEISKGIVPWIRIDNQILSTVDQGGKRKGSGAVYIPIWHIDVFEFLDLRKTGGPEDMRARDCFYGLTIPDEFMRRVLADEDWMLMCPNKAKTLSEIWGLEFEMEYRALEKLHTQNNTPFTRKVKARDLWIEVVKTIMEVGMPYIIFIDACNRKSNQKNIGKIKLSNLCTEIMLFTDKDNISSCTLGSVVLDACIIDGKFDFKELERLTRSMVRNLNQTIDRNYYSPDVPEIKYTNMRTRPLGLGICALADTFAKLDYIWDSPEAKQLNKDILEVMYISAVSESVELAKVGGHYELFPGSPASEGKFQFDLWDEERVERDFASKAGKVGLCGLDELRKAYRKPDRKSFYSKEHIENLRQDMIKYGMLNSTLIALMPTATSAGLLNKNECFEPFTHLIGTRRVLSGEFVITNEYLVNDLEKIELWNTASLQELWKKGRINGLNEEGLSGEKLERLKYLKQKYTVAYDMKQKLLLGYQVERGEFVCQSQSFNGFMTTPNYRKITSFLFDGWKQGLKTGLYYMRREAAADPTNASLNTLVIPENAPKTAPKFVCTEKVCTFCSC